jgi:hypothetical protein
MGGIFYSAKKEVIEMPAFKVWIFIGVLWLLVTGVYLLVNANKVSKN